MNNLSEVEQHEKLKQLNMAVYKPLEKPFVNEYKLIKRFTDNTGFYAGVYQNLNDIVVVFRGTEINDINDLKNDVEMIRNHLPTQAQSALEAYDKVAEFCENNGYSLTVTGHSLGGSLAAIVSAERDVPAVTFNPYGVKDLLPSGLTYNEDKIINYRSQSDPVSWVSVRNIIGKSYNVPSEQGPKSHFLENMGSLYQRKEGDFPPTFFERFGQILSNVSNSISNFSNNAMNRILKDLHNLQSEMKENYFVSDKSIQDFIDDIDKDINKLDSAIMNYALSQGYDLPKQAKENLKKVKDITNSLLSKYSQKVIKGRISNKTYIWHSEPNACGVCADLDGTEYDNEWEIPAKPHPNCKCTIEKVYDR